MIDPHNVFVENGPGLPLAKIPSWWSSFIFHVLNGRQLSLYAYLVMLMGDTQMCHPTTQEIASDLGLASSTMIFEAINALEVRGFILRARRRVEHLGSRRNVYQRPSCEHTLLALLRRKYVDGCLRPLPYHQGGSSEGEALRRQGLLSLLGDQYARYDRTADSAKADVLEGVLLSRFSR